MPFCPSCGTQVAAGAVCGCKTHSQSQQQHNPYSQPPPQNPYSQPPPPQSPYGQPQQNPYSQPQQNPYAQQPQQQNPYSQPQQQNPYGQPQQQNPYGQPPQQNPYGQPQQNPYAQPQQSPYGQPQQSPYGQPRPAYGSPYGMQRGGSGGMMFSPFDIIAMVCAGLGIIMVFLPFVSASMLGQSEGASLFKIMTEAESPIMFIFIAVSIAAAAALCFIKKLHFAIKIIPAGVALILTMFYALFNKLELLVAMSGGSTSGMSAAERQMASEMANEMVDIGVGAIILLIAMAGYITVAIISGVKKS